MSATAYWGVVALCATLAFAAAGHLHNVLTDVEKQLRDLILWNSENFPRKILDIQSQYNWRVPVETYYIRRRSISRSISNSLIGIVIIIGCACFSHLFEPKKGRFAVSEDIFFTIQLIVVIAALMWLLICGRALVRYRKLPSEIPSSYEGEKPGPSGGGGA